MALSLNDGLVVISVNPRSMLARKMVKGVLAVGLNDIAHRFPAGHQIRLSLSTSYWPLVWPAPTPVTLSIEAGNSRLELPLRTAHDLDATLTPFGPAEAAPTKSIQTALRPNKFTRSFERDLTTNDTVYRLYSAGGDLDTGSVMHIDAINMELGHTVERRFSIGENDPLSACARISEDLLMRRGEWSIRVSVVTELTATENQFLLRAKLSAREGDSAKEIFTREWDEVIARDCL